MGADEFLKFQLCCVGLTFDSLLLTIYLACAGRDEAKERNMVPWVHLKERYNIVRKSIQIVPAQYEKSEVLN